jgi:Cu/Zn superoxide dismutase
MMWDAVTVPHSSQQVAISTPTNRQHGFLNPLGPHAGDLPNIEVPSTTQRVADALSLSHFSKGRRFNIRATALVRD